MRGNICPCCSAPLLRHASSRGVYWFCTSCSQEMPTAQMASVLSRKAFFRKDGVKKAQVVG
jgi:hypothetical protein